MEDPTSRMRVAMVVGFHITTALASTLLSKAVLNILAAPVLLLLCQSLICLATMAIGIALGWYTPPKLDRHFIQGISPILGMKVVAQVSKTFCLLHVNASFYQIARGLLLPFTVVLSFALLKKSRLSDLGILACVVTTAGFVWGIEGEAVGQTSMTGIAWGVWSSFTTALETVVIKSFATKTGALDLVYLTSLTTIPVYAALATLTGEVYVISSPALNHAVVVQFLKAVMVSGVFNFAMSAAAYLQITVTSPVTHMISTSARGILQSILAVVFLNHENFSQSRIISILIILAGTLTYTVSKEIEMKDHAATKVGLPVFNGYPSDKQQSHIEQPGRGFGGFDSIEKH